VVAALLSGKAKPRRDAASLLLRGACVCIVRHAQRHMNATLI
jgi:hypothetical protein